MIFVKQQLCGFKNLFNDLYMHMYRITIEYNWVGSHRWELNIISHQGSGIINAQFIVELVGGTWTGPIPCPPITKAIP